MTGKEYERIIREEKPASRRNDIKMAVNLKLSKKAARLEDEAEEFYYDKLCVEVEYYEQEYGVRPVFEMEDMSYDDPRTDNYGDNPYAYPEWPDDKAAVENLITGLVEAFETSRKIWNDNPGWSAKLVSVDFKLRGEEFALIPESLTLSSDGWDQGFMQSKADRITEGLETIGATDIVWNGVINNEV